MNLPCVWFEMMGESRVLYLYLLNALGNIAGKRQASFSFLDEACLINEIEQMMQKQKRIRAIMIGTPSLLKEGKISHCDIPELDGCDLVGKFTVVVFSVMVHMENDMHYRVLRLLQEKLPAGISIPRFLVYLKKILFNKKSYNFF